MDLFIAYNNSCLFPCLSVKFAQFHVEFCSSGDRLCLSYDGVIWVVYDYLYMLFIILVKVIGLLFIVIHEQSLLFM